MNIIKLVSLLVLVLLFANGCAQKTTIKAIKAAKVSDRDIKYIGVLPFDNDNIAQGSQIDSEISNAIINGKKHFILVDRTNLKKVMSEKKLNDSGLVNLINDNEDTGLTQVKTLVTGKVNISSMASSNYYETRTDYNTCYKYNYYKGKRSSCARYRTYSVSCMSNIYSVNTKIKLIKVTNSSVIFTKNYNASNKLTHCDDDSRVLPRKNDYNSRLAAIISKQLIKDIAPSYVYFNVVLFDAPDIEYSALNETILKAGLSLIKNKRMEKANTIFKKLNKNTKGQSYVALYNLGVTEEALGNVQRALELYKKAEDISLLSEPNEEISNAIRRSEKNLIELNKANNQL